MARIYCSNCGQLIPENSNFCKFCGAPQRGEESALYRAQAAPIERATLPAPEVIKTQSTLNSHLQREVVPRRHLAPRAVWLFFINYNIRMAILFPFFGVGIYYEPLVAVILMAYLITVFMIASLVYNYFYFSVDDQGFQNEYGILHKRHVSVPFRQIQNVNILRTVTDRLLGIAKLEIETAGSSNIKRRDIIGGVRSKAEGVLPGLTLADAQHLHDVLLQRKEYRRHHSQE